MTKFPPEDHAAVSAAAVEAVLMISTEGEDGNAPPWRQGDENASEVLFDIINSRSALSGPGNDGQRFDLIRHPHRHRAGGVRKGHDNLLAKNRRRA